MASNALPLLHSARDVRVTSKIMQKITKLQKFMNFESFISETIGSTETILESHIVENLVFFINFLKYYQKLVLHQNLKKIRNFRGFFDICKKSELLDLAPSTPYWTRSLDY